MAVTMMLPPTRLIELLSRLGRWQQDPDRTLWEQVFLARNNEPVVFQLADRSYFLDIHRIRLASAVDRGNSAIADKLNEVVGRLDDMTESSVAFAMVSWRGSGFFVWLDAGMSEVITYMRLDSKRASSAEDSMS